MTTKDSETDRLWRQVVDLRRELAVAQRTNAVFTHAEFRTLTKRARLEQPAPPPPDPRSRPLPSLDELATRKAQVQAARRAKRGAAR